MHPFRFLIATAIKDLRRRRRDPLALIVWAAIPLAIATLMQLAFGGGDDTRTPQARVLVADHDSTVVSRALRTALSSGPLAELIVTEGVAETVGRERLDRGDGTALLVIPAGFASNLLADEPTTLALITNPAQRILPRIVEEILAVLEDGAFYAQRLLGDVIRDLAEPLPPGALAQPDSLVASASVRINRIMAGIAPTLFPPLIELEVIDPDAEEDEASASGVDFGALFLPSMLSFALLLVSQGMSTDIWRERQQGTLRRSFVAPQGMPALLAGKTLAAAVILAGIGLLGLGVGRFLFRLELHNIGVAAVWITLAGAVLFVLLTGVQTLAGSERAGSMLTTVIVFPLAMMGGGFFPLEVMPDWLAAIGRWTPNGWALVHLNAVLQDRAGVVSLVGAAGGLLAVGAFFFFLSVARLRRGFAAG